MLTLSWQRLTGVFCLMSVSLTTTALFAADTIERENKPTIRGDIVSILREEVGIRAGGGEQKIPSGEITSIRFDGEPAEMNLARSAVESGRYDDALEKFTELQNQGFTGRAEPFLKQDAQFYIAISTAELAMAGARELSEAKTLLDQFVSDHRNSFHVLRAYETLGEVNAAMADYSAAEQAFGELTKSQQEYYKVRGLVAQGQALIQQGKASQAEQKFNDALQQSQGKEDLASLTKSAQLGKAGAMAASGQTKQAIQMVEELLNNSPEDSQLYAKAYNTLGFCYAQSNQPKEAMLNYLKVDVLYPHVPQAHAEALYNLVGLWQEMDKSRYSQDAKASLMRLYGNSPWAKKLQ
ncbi:Hypothetical protein PBC10988_14870 [Planctomycetales bacterium 10988]|nr:Hypothetical protein PBC10988_14870 [Planctomycetales bacterium 10988]